MAEKQRVLIVDDDENIAELISLYLMKECYETRIVHDGEAALKIFPEFKPNIILLDLMLPGIDGYQVCRELRATSQRVNLFEKVKIPETEENIRKISIYLADQQVNAVVRSKIAKRKIAARGAAPEGQVASL